MLDGKEVEQFHPSETWLSGKHLLNLYYPIIEMQANESGVDYIKAPLNIENDHLIGSSLHIKQILQNIVSNAVKYNKRGGYVRVSCTENRIDEKNIMFEFVCTLPPRTRSGKSLPEATAPLSRS